MTQHFLNRCSCGRLISQCRCPGDRVVTVVERGCQVCRGQDPPADAVPPPRRPRPKKGPAATPGRKPGRISKPRP